MGYPVGKEAEDMKYLKIFTDFLEVVEPLSDVGAGRLFKAMLRYALDGRLPALKGREGVAWTMARQHIDREAADYAAKVKSMERARSARKQTDIRQNTMPLPLISREDKEKDNDNGKDKDKDSLSTGGAEALEEREKRPTLSEVMAFSQREGIQTDVEYFYNYYEAIGWRMGSLPMQNWQAALRAWAKKAPLVNPAPAREPSVGDNFNKAMEIMRRKEAKEI